MAFQLYFIVVYCSDKFYVKLNIYLIDSKTHSINYPGLPVYKFAKEKVKFTTEVQNFTIHTFIEKYGNLVIDINNRFLRSFPITTINDLNKCLVKKFEV